MEFLSCRTHDCDGFDMLAAGHLLYEPVAQLPRLVHAFVPHRIQGMRFKASSLWLRGLRT